MAAMAVSRGRATFKLFGHVMMATIWLFIATAAATTTTALAASSLSAAAPAEGANGSRSSSSSGYGEQQFLAAYRNPRVTHHVVRGDVYLTTSLPPRTKSLTIVGRKGLGGRGDRPVIDGCSRFSGFVFFSDIDGGDDVKLTLQNLELRNFRRNGDGAAITASPPLGGGRVELFECVFRNNRAMAGGHGGALSLSQVRYYNVTRCRFIGNRAAGSGGAFYSNSDGRSRGSIIDCVFTNNSAQLRGGAVVINSAYVAEVNKRHSLRNKASVGDGGTLSFESSVVVVSNCRFRNNEAGRYGGTMSVMEVYSPEKMRLRGNPTWDPEAVAETFLAPLWPDIMANAQKLVPHLNLTRTKLKAQS